MYDIENTVCSIGKANKRALNAKAKNHDGQDYESNEELSEKNKKIPKMNAIKNRKKNVEKEEKIKK